MSLRERCDEIIRLSDTVLDPGHPRGAAEGALDGRATPALAVIPVATLTHARSHPLAARCEG